jgi:hypothetical protein
MEDKGAKQDTSKWPSANHLSVDGLNYGYPSYSTLTKFPIFFLK